VTGPFEIMGSEYTDRLLHRQDTVTPGTESFCRQNPPRFPQTFDSPTPIRIAKEPPDQ
jgi:hypothetical protein